MITLLRKAPETETGTFLIDSLPLIRLHLVKPLFQ